MPVPAFKIHLLYDANKMKKTGERVVPEKFGSKEEYLIFLQHLFAYEFAKKMIYPGSSILEIGCGSGYGAGLLSETASGVIGLDVDKEAVDYSNEKYGTKKCIFKQYDGTGIPFADNTFDAAVSFQVMEHIADDDNYVSEIHRVLKQGGMFLITTPNRLIRLKKGQKPFNRFHVREYSPDELAEKLKKYFSGVEIKGVIGTEEIKYIELCRVKKIRKIVDMDVLNIRNMLPETVILSSIKLIKKCINRKKNDSDADFDKNFSTKDYSTTEELASCLDLLAICRK